VLDDLRQLLGSDLEASRKWGSGRVEVVELHKLLRGQGLRLREIEVDAEENMFKLVRSNEEMVKLEQLMSLIKDDMNRQLQEEEEHNQLNLTKIE
jgi:hypothetical protein